MTHNWNQDDFDQVLQEIDRLGTYVQRRIDEYANPGCSPRDSEFERARNRLRDLVPWAEDHLPDIGERPLTADEVVVGEAINVARALGRTMRSNPTAANVEATEDFIQQARRILDKP